MTAQAEPAPDKLSPERLRELWDLSGQPIAAEATFKAFLKVKLERQAIRDFVVGLGPRRPNS